MNMRSIQSTLALTVVLAFAVTALAPAVEASHLTLYHTRTTTGQSADPGFGVTWEDDGEIVHQPGGDLDGVVNKVSLQTTDTIGDGSLFLDAEWYADAYLMFGSNQALAGNSDKMITGFGAFIAKYGLFNDLDGDGEVDDFHDSGACPPTFACTGLDEFTWKGQSSGDAVTMALYVLPSNLAASSISRGAERLADVSTSPAWEPSGQFGTWQDGTDSTPDTFFDDRTDQADQQLWVNGGGWSYVWTDESLLITTQTVVVAGAAPDSSDVGFDLTDVEALIDVDTYESADPALEALWVSTLTPIPSAIREARATPQNIGPIVNGYAAMVSAAINDVSRTINDITTGQTPVAEVIESTVGPTRDSALDIAQPYVDAADEGGAQAIESFVNPAWLKEPNHAADVFPAAAFGGTPSPNGIGNDYSGHATAYHLFMDARLHLTAPNAANVDLEPLSTGVGVYGHVGLQYESLPCQDCTAERGVSPGLIMSTIAVSLWQDTNGDGWVGDVCNPSSEDEWDAENNVCNDTNDNRYDGFPATGFYDDADENYLICGTTTLNGNAQGVMIAPVAGSTWEDAPGAFVLRQFRQPTNNVWHTERFEQVPLTGTEPIHLGTDACAQDASTITVDALVLPSGTLSINLVSQVTGTMTKPFNDKTTGITIPVESVTDVDVYFAAL